MVISTSGMSFFVSSQILTAAAFDGSILEYHDQFVDMKLSDQLRIHPSELTVIFAIGANPLTPRRLNRA